MKCIDTKRIAFITIIVSYILIVFGGYVASSQSGMGCGPEWPLCNGEVIPVLQDETLIEFTHRFIGLILAVFTAVLYFKVKQKEVERGIRRVASWMAILLAIQIVAGAIVVWFDLPAIVVTIHLLIAMIFLFTLLWIYRADRQLRFKAAYIKNMEKHMNRLLVLLFITLGLGAYIKHQSYGLACGWLDCRDTILPVSGPQFLQTSHRLAAVVTVIYLIYVVYLAFTKKWSAEIKRRMMLALFIGVVQVLVGVITVMTIIPVSWAVVHLAIGTALYIVIADTRICLGGAGD